MKIADSAVALNSTNNYFSYKYSQSKTIEARASVDARSAILTLSKNEELTNVEAMERYEAEKKAAQEQQAKENDQRNLEEMLKRMREEFKAQEANNKTQFSVPEVDEDAEIKMLKRMLAILRGEKYEEENHRINVEGKDALDLRSAEFKASSDEELAVGVVGGGSIAGTGNRNIGSIFERITAVSGYTLESQDTTFSAVGTARTTDGREINFNVDVTMSSAFMEEFNSLSMERYVYCDPLVINLEDGQTTVSDKKYYFDLDSDGKEEEVSFAGKGSGFLALDKNNDGEINDGSELFGTKSGNGFADLAAYDEDGNGWIDESDSVFSRLKVWTKDDQGNDKLLDLKKADVGAIYLGSAQTDFNIRGDDNSINGKLRRTGVYLKESTGAAGTVAHVDLAL